MITVNGKNHLRQKLKSGNALYRMYKPLSNRWSPSQQRQDSTYLVQHHLNFPNTEVKQKIQPGCFYFKPVWCLSTACHLPTQADRWAGYSFVLDWLHYKGTQEWIPSVESIYGIQKRLPSMPKKQTVAVTLRDRLCYHIHGIRELERIWKKATFPSQQCLYLSKVHLHM